jgi:hypothetical protein
MDWECGTGITPDVAATAARNKENNMYKDIETIIKAERRGKLAFTRVSITTIIELTGKTPQQWWGDGWGRDVSSLQHLEDEKRQIYRWSREDQRRLIKKYVEKQMVMKIRNSSAMAALELMELCGI